LADSDNPVAAIASQISLLQQGLTNIGEVLQQSKSKPVNSTNDKGLAQLNETLAALELQVNIEKPDSSMLENTLTTFSEKLEQFLAPLADALQSSKTLDFEMINALSQLTPTGSVTSDTESEIHRISRQLIKERVAKHKQKS